MNAPVAAPLISMVSALEPTADPAWVIRQHGFDPLRDSSHQSRFAVSNGFLGIPGKRAINRSAQAGLPPRTYVAGLFDIGGAEQPIPALVPAADWLRVNILLPGGPSAMNPEDVSNHDRTLDMRRGTLLTSGSLVGMPGLAIHLRVLRLVSLNERAIGLQLIELRVEEGAFDITFEASFDGLDFGLKADHLEQDVGVWRTRSSGKRLAMAPASSLWLDGPGAGAGQAQSLQVRLDVADTTGSGRVFRAHGGRGTKRHAGRRAWRQRAGQTRIVLPPGLARRP